MGSVLKVVDVGALGVVAADVLICMPGLQASSGAEEPDTNRRKLEVQLQTSSEALRCRAFDGQYLFR